MRRIAVLAAIASGALLLGRVPAAGRVTASQPSQQVVQPRLVVFEAFHRKG